MKQFISFTTKEILNSLLTKRDGEIRFGEGVQLLEANNWQQQMEQSNARFVLLGIPEDVGVRANYGIGGAHTAWLPTLKALLNVQETAEVSGGDMIILGQLNCAYWMQEAEGKTADELRSLVAELDEAIYPIIKAIVAAGKIPIVVGGGHNNAYPLLKGTSLALQKPIDCINLDAHSDYRRTEGRHSGNGFRYAKQEGYLHKYAMVGLHANYNSSTVMEEIAQDASIRYSSYEDIAFGRLSFADAVTDAIDFCKSEHTGVELDVDCIANVLSSAATPCGISGNDALYYLAACAANLPVAYLHLAEGVAQLSDGRENPLVGKMLTYFITAFIRNV